MVLEYYTGGYLPYNYILAIAGGLSYIASTSQEKL